MAIRLSIQGEEKDVSESRFSVAVKSAFRTLLFAIATAIYTQETARPNSSLRDYGLAICTALVAAIGKGISSFFTASSVRVK